MGLSGCATTRPLEPAASLSGSGDATWHGVEAPGTRHYQLSLGETASGSSLLQVVAPVYPKDMLLRCPPSVAIAALVVVDNRGAVSDVRVDPTVEADPTLQPFVTAVRSAVNRWNYSPLAISHVAADANGSTHVVDRETKPFSLSYVFNFSCHGGRGSTHTQRAASPPG